MSNHSNSTNNKSMDYYSQIDIPTSSIARLAPMIRACMACRLVAILIGAAGSGKTELIKQISKAMGADLLHLYTAHLGAEELKGLFFRSAENTKTYSVLCNEELFEAIEAARTGKPLIIFLDELNRASDVDCLNALFSMISKRGVPGLDFPDNVYLVAAGNPPTGNFAVSEMSDDAYIRRLVWFGVKVDAGVWLKYASGKKSFSIGSGFSMDRPEELPLHDSVTSYIAANPAKLADPLLADKGKPHPNPASGTAASQVLKVLEREEENSNYNVKTILSGLIGGTMARGFFDHYADGDIQVSPEDLLDQKWSVSRSKLEDLKKDSRHDLISELAQAVVTHVRVNMPVLLKTQVTNICEFLAWVDEDIQGLVVKGWKVNADDADNSEWETYKTKLMFRLQKNTKFQEVMDNLKELVANNT